MLTFTLSLSPWAIQALVRLVSAGETEEVPGIQELAAMNLVAGEQRKIAVPLVNGLPGQRGEAQRFVFVLTPAGQKMAELLAMYAALGEPYETLYRLLNPEPKP